MARTSFSIASWMVAIALVALDIVALTPFARSGRSSFGKDSDPFLDACILPLAMTLQGLFVISINRRGRIGPGLAGFQVAGWVAVALFAGICSTPGLLASMFAGLEKALEAAGLDVAAYGRVSAANPLLRLLVGCLILIGPPWCLAAMGGFVAGRAFRRRRASPVMVG